MLFSFLFSFFDFLNVPRETFYFHAITCACFT
nr:MAG TPA_asm: hypothetical protein [Caudoviricetes sp.]